MDKKAKAPIPQKPGQEKTTEPKFVKGTIEPTTKK